MNSTQVDSFIADLLVKFFRDIDYHSQNPITDDNASYQALKNEFSAFNTGLRFDTLCRHSAALAELPYPGHSDEVRIQVAKCTWFLLYLDDLGHKLPGYLTDFQRRVITTLDTIPEDNLFRAHREFLADFYRFYDPIPANCIILSCMDFVNGCALEETSTIRDMKLTDAAQSWPYFLRKKTGHAHAYAFMLFPREVKLDMSTYIQVIDDMVDFINLGNDILSFYKEELAGERNNYVHSRSFVNKRTIEETLNEMINEALEAHAKISEALETMSTAALVIWKQFVNGYMAFHFNQERYRLHELNLGVS